MNEVKVYVDVVAHFDKEGNITPITIQWENGKIYEIDRVLDVRRCSSLRAGGSGMRYIVRISGHNTSLFYEEPAWFVERRRT